MRTRTQTPPLPPSSTCARVHATACHSGLVRPDREEWLGIWLGVIAPAHHIAPGPLLGIWLDGAIATGPLPCANARPPPLHPTAPTTTPLEPPELRLKHPQLPEPAGAAPCGGGPPGAHHGRRRPPLGGLQGGRPLWQRARRGRAWACAARGAAADLCCARAAGGAGRAKPAAAASYGLIGWRRRRPPSRAASVLAGWFACVRQQRSSVRRRASVAFHICMMARLRWLGAHAGVCHSMRACVHVT